MSTSLGKHQGALATRYTPYSPDATSANTRSPKHNATVTNSTSTSPKQVRLTSHSCVPPVWQCTLRAVLASMQPTSRTRPPSATALAGKRFLKRIPRYLHTHKSAQLSAYRTFGFRSTVALAESPHRVPSGIAKKPRKRWYRRPVDIPTRVASNTICNTFDIQHNTRLWMGREHQLYSALLFTFSVLSPLIRVAS